MKRITYKDFLSQLIQLKNGEEKVLVTKHPWRPETRDTLPFNPEAYYWIYKKSGIMTSDQVGAFIDDEPLYEKFINQGKITREQLEENIKDRFTESEFIIVRTLERQLQLYFYPSIAEAVVGIIDSSWRNNGERKLLISPFELPDININQELWRSGRKGDKIEDTVSDIDCITKKEFWDRIEFLRTNFEMPNLFL